MDEQEIKILDKFVDTVLDEYVELCKCLPSSISMAKNIYDPFFGMYAHSPFTVSTHIHYRGVMIFEGTNLQDNYLEIGNILKKFEPRSPAYHACHNNLKRYVGFRTEIYDYCTVCNKQFEVELWKK